MVPEKGMWCVVLALKICELPHKVTQPKCSPGERSRRRHCQPKLRSHIAVQFCQGMEEHLLNDY